MPCKTTQYVVLTSELAGRCILRRLGGRTAGGEGTPRRQILPQSFWRQLLPRFGQCPCPVVAFPSSVRPLWQAIPHFH